MFSHFVIRSHTFLLSFHAFSPAFHHALSFCYTFLCVPVKFSYVLPHMLIKFVKSDTFLYVLCDSHAYFAKKVFSFKFNLDSMVMPPPGPFNKQQKGGGLAILC